MNSDRIVILTVTYGERSALLRETVGAALEDADTHLVVVSNGGSSETIDLLDESRATYPERVSVIRFEENVGSAPAFGAGLRAAYELDAPILILDDDNPVNREKLARLRHLAGLAPFPNMPFAIAVHRPINDAQRAILRGEPVDRVFRELIPGAFHGFDLVSALRWWRRSSGNPAQVVRWGDNAQGVDLRELPVAMWGGLFLSREGARLCALPLEDLVLYCDDNDFSRDFTAKGGTIFLTDALSITDTNVWRPPRATDRGWRRRLPSTFSTPESDLWRLQYLFRNQAYISQRQAGRHAAARMRLIVNATARIALIGMLALIAGRPRLGLRLTSASISGLRGKLGRTYFLPN